MIRTVLHEPNQELRVVSSPVSDERILSSSMTKLVEDLQQTMVQENGVGIAAPQIGVHERIIIAETKTGVAAYFNPEITERSFKMIESEEGCLSVPGTWGMVKRHRSVTVVAKNDKAEVVTIKADGLDAVVFQHEIDHLDGILFIDRAEEITKGTNL